MRPFSRSPSVTFNPRPMGLGRWSLIFFSTVTMICLGVFLAYAWPRWVHHPAVNSAAATNTALSENPAKVAVMEEVPGLAETPVVNPAPSPTEGPKVQSAGPSNPETDGHAASRSLEGTAPGLEITGVPAVVGPVDPAQAVETMAAALMAGDVAALRRTLGSRLVDPTTMAALEELIKRDAYQLDTGNAVSKLGSQPELQRWALNFRKSDQADKSVRLEVDFARDTQGGWWPLRLRLPGSEDGSVPGLVAEPEAMEVALVFARSMAAGDLASALEVMAPGRVSPASLAGLGILLAQGEFALKPDAEVQTTVARPDSAWLLFPVVSEPWRTEARFGLVLQRLPDGKWVVSALNLDSLMAVSASRIGGGDAAFTPFIRQAGQGESLAIYFEAKSSSPDMNAKTIVQMVAGMVAADPMLRVILHGHGDALEKEGAEKSLSKARAASVLALLVGAGMDSERATCEAHGASRPRRANFRPDGSDDAAARKINRRVEIQFIR